MPAGRQSAEPTTYLALHGFRGRLLVLLRGRLLILLVLLVAGGRRLGLLLGGRLGRGLTWALDELIVVLVLERDTGCEGDVTQSVRVSRAAAVCCVCCVPDHTSKSDSDSESSIVGLGRFRAGRLGLASNSSSSLSSCARPLALPFLFPKSVRLISSSSESDDIAVADGLLFVDNG